ncbi:hypothetical protein [Escherichia phage UPEC07]|nr:hypothetical protein [Escherichia phage UPEC07]
MHVFILGNMIHHLKIMASQNQPQEPVEPIMLLFISLYNGSTVSN